VRFILTTETELEAFSVCILETIRKEHDPSRV